MARKFLGERIENGIDFKRPASLTLTSEDLLRLPDLPEEHTHILKIGSSEINGKPNKISRKFGGTIRLKQRLSSVPELFLRELKLNSNRATSKKIKKRPTDEFARHVSQFHAIEEETIPYNRIVKDDADLVSKVFISKPILMPVMMGAGPKPLQMDLSKNNNIPYPKNNLDFSHDNIFEEILSSYNNDFTYNSTVLESELDSVLQVLDKKGVNNKAKKGGYSTPKIIAQDMDSISLNTIPNFEQADDKVNLAALMSSPEYTGSSSTEQWSSCEEFSDLDSIGVSLNNTNNFNGYTTANNSISLLPSPSQIKNTMERVSLQKIQLNHHIFTPEIDYLSEEDTLQNRRPQEELYMETFDSSLQILQERIRSIDIASTITSICST